MTGLLRNARIGAGGPVRDIAVAEGRIVHIGQSLPSGAESLDLDGRTVLPGLWDAHVHSVQWAAARRRIDVSAAGSAAEAVEIIGKNAPSGVIFGGGFRDGLWSDSPHKDMLEAALPGRQVLITSNDLHTAWLSPAALAVVGAGGHSTGVVREEECFAITAAFPQASVE
jgi:hypothetical protein